MSDIPGDVNSSILLLNGDYSAKKFAQPERNAWKPFDGFLSIINQKFVA
jgi:hypothetical protein